MKLIVGLGNPEEKFFKTRHNVGFLLIDKLVQVRSLLWESNSKFNSYTSYDPLGDIRYLKPQTYMNNSGEAVSKALSYYKLGVDSLTVLHDDIDLPFGKIKFQKNSGSAGHHGIEDIVLKIGSADFWRLRFGVGKPQISAQVPDYVLSDFTVEELAFIAGVDVSKLIVG